ncbi:sulfate transporter family-domain-containing protein [Gongronella butleri]|nr:sulfate transporter family-domain-containing protein [Gongronella butleri]
MTHITLDYTAPSFKEQWRNFKQAFPWAARRYVTSFFPMRQWILHYNVSWLLQDLIAGITVGMVMVPQGMAYAKIANLDPQYGLYASFLGPMIYCVFGTSKDISIGMISVISLLVGQAVQQTTSAYSDITGAQVATTLSLFTGLVITAIGLVRLGILIDFIPGPAIAGYMCGSAITISLGQWPKLFGLVQVNAHQAPYKIIIGFFSHLSDTTLDAAFGVTALALLYVIKFGCRWVSRRVGRRWARAVFYVEIMRNGVMVVLGTLVSFAIGGRGIHIIRDVPAGLVAIGVPSMDTRVLGESTSVLPSMIIILILEHVSVAKSFGRMDDYTIQANQEIFTIGFANILGSFFGAPPATGAFSRSAIMARSGVATPLAGIFTGAVVLLALYVLTPCFFYIPDAVLAAVVIHAVTDLVTKPSYVKQLFSTSLAEGLIWVSSVLVILFVNVPVGIYVGVGLSLALMLVRIARPPRIKVLARVPVGACENEDENEERRALLHGRRRNIYVDERDVHFLHVARPLPEGVLVFRLDEALLYPNVEHVTEMIFQKIKRRTRRGQTGEPGELDGKSAIPAWNKVGDTFHGDMDVSRPVLKALVLDFSAVQRLDATALSCLASLRANVEAYACGAVPWHFCGVHRYEQVRHDLLAFGLVPPAATSKAQPPRLSSCATDTMTTSSPCSSHYQVDDQWHENRREHKDKVQEPSQDASSSPTTLSVMVDEDPMHGLPRDACHFFHWDVDAAIHALSPHL